MIHGDRHKLQVWSETQQRWRTAYVKNGMLGRNVTRLMSFGFIVRYYL